MAAQQPSINSDEGSRQRRLYQFQERAANVVLDREELSAEQWNQLVRLADQMELSRSDLVQLVQEWLRRGVLRSSEVAFETVPAGGSDRPKVPDAEHRDQLNRTLTSSLGDSLAETSNSVQSATPAAGETRGGRISRIDPARGAHARDDTMIPAELIAPTNTSATPREPRTASVHHAPTKRVAAGRTESSARAGHQGEVLDAEVLAEPVRAVPLPPPPPSKGTLFTDSLRSGASDSPPLAAGQASDSLGSLPAAPPVRTIPMPLAGVTPPPLRTTPPTLTPPLNQPEGRAGSGTPEPPSGARGDRSANASGSSVMATDVATPRGASSSMGRSSFPASVTSPASQPGGDEVSPPEDRQRRFLMRAAAIIAEQRGMGPRTQTLLLVTARELGIPDDEAAAALRGLAGGAWGRTDSGDFSSTSPGSSSSGPVSPPPAPGRPAGPDSDGTVVRSPAATAGTLPGVAAPTDATGTSADSASATGSGSSAAPPVLRGAGRTADAPAKPARKRADDEFRKWVSAQLARYVAKGLPPELVEQWVMHGRERYKLSEVFARDLVFELAESMQLALRKSVPQAASGESPGGLADTDPVGASGQRANDPRIAAFLSRAGSILAVHRGLNAKSRVLLAAVAREVGFADDEQELAFRSLEGSRPLESTEESTHQRRLPPFLHVLREQLIKLPHGVVTHAVQESVVEQAEQRFGLDGDASRAALRQVVGELKLKVISETEAVRHIEGLVAEAMGESLHVAPHLVPRLIAEGARWGLGRERVEEVIHNRSKFNYRQQHATAQVSNLALWGAGLACLIVVGFFVWAVLGSTFFPDESDRIVADRSADPAAVTDASTVSVAAAGPGVTSPRDSAAASTSRSRAPDTSWWSPLMLVATREARAKLGFSPELLDDMAAADETQRIEAYRNIAPLLYDSETNTQTQLVLEQILAEAFAHDPSEAAAEALGRSILAHIPGPTTRLSDQPDDYPRMFQSLRIALSCVAASQKSTTRVQQMSDLLNEAIGARLNPSLKVREQRADCYHALAEHLFRLLIAAAGAQPNLVVPLHPIITREVNDYLEPNELETLQADFLVALLSTDETPWREFRNLLGGTVRSRDSLTVAKLVDLFEMVKDEELGAFLEGLLIDRTELRTTTSQRAELARELRAALGVTVTRTAEGRQRRFQQLANQQLSRLQETPDAPLDMLTETMRLAYLTTLGAALAQNELGEAVFDALEKEGLPLLSVGSAADRSTAARVADADWSLLEGIDRDLQVMASQGPAGRFARIEALSRVADRLPDIRPAQARILASYLLMNKPDNEHQAILKHIPALVRWPQLRLALADQLESGKLTRDQFIGIFTHVLDAPITPASLAAGLNPIRAAILAKVVTKLDQESTPTDTNVHAPQLDQAREKITMFYRKQVELAGGSAEQAASLASPAEALTILIERQAERMASLSLKTEDQRRVAVLPHELNAISYVASDDLHAAVLLQRIWIEQQAISLRVAAPMRVSDITAMLSQLAKQDRESTNILVQFRNGQATLVRLQLIQQETR